MDTNSSDLSFLCLLSLAVEDRWLFTRRKKFVMLCFPGKHCKNKKQNYKSALDCKPSVVHVHSSCRQWWCKNLVFKGQMSWPAKINRTFVLVTITIHEKVSFPDKCESDILSCPTKINGTFGEVNRTISNVRHLAPSLCRSCSCYMWFLSRLSLKFLTFSLPRVINFNFLLQSLTRDISYSMENLAINSLLRWKLIEQSFLTTSLNHFLLE